MGRCAAVHRQHACRSLHRPGTRRVRPVERASCTRGIGTMKRIDVYYDGHVYSVGQRELDDVQHAIAEGQANGGMWLLVNDGEGTRRDAYLWIGAGTSIALVPIPDEQGEEVAGGS